MDSHTLDCVSFHHRGKPSFHTVIKCKPFRPFVHDSHFILLCVCVGGGGKSLIGDGGGARVFELRGQSRNILYHVNVG